MTKSQGQRKVKGYKGNKINNNQINRQTNKCYHNNIILDNIASAYVYL